MIHANNTIRVVVVGPLPPPVHGVTISTRRLLESRIHEDFSVFHLDTSDHRDMRTVGAIDFTNIWLALKNYLDLFRISFRYRPHIVYVPISQTLVGFARDLFYFAVPKLLARSRVIIHLRGGYFGEFYDRGGFLTRKLIDAGMRFVDRVIVLGDCFRPIFAKWFPAESIDVVPNGTDFMNDEAYDKKLFRDGYPVVAYLSGLVRTKGIVDFVKAALLVASHQADVHFYVAGEWWSGEQEAEEEVKAMLAAAPAALKIQFIGLVSGDAKRELLKRTDIFVLPTYYPFEGHPNSIVEAMAAGCAVISTNHAAIPETVIDGMTGIIVPPKDPNRLANAILSLVGDLDELKRFSHNSFSRFRRFYTAEKSNSALIDSFKKALFSGRSIRKGPKGFLPQSRADIAR